MTKYMDRRTKKFKSLEENVRKLLKQELDIDVIRIDEIEDKGFIYDNEQMLRILVKFYQKFRGKEFKSVECGRDVYVSKDLFNTVQDWSGLILRKRDRPILDLALGQNVLNTV